MDGEATEIDQRLVKAHLDRCGPCRSYAAGIERSAQTADRRVRTQVGGEPVPDLSRRVAGLAAVADRAATWSIVRGLLAVVAVQILVFSIPALVLGDEQATSAHSARHIGAFTVAYAVGLLVVVVRPARSRTMLPVAAVLAGALLITAVVDLANARVPLIDEAEHLPELLSVVLVWLVAVPSPRRRRVRSMAAADVPQGAGVRVVQGGERRAV